ncbi:MAG: hypothetical protein U0838_01630 [Chloroflexota bacterium]
MELEFVILADAANLSKEGKLNVLGAFESIGAPSFPVTHPVMTVVTRLRAMPTERGRKMQIGIDLLDADGGSLASVEAETQVPHDPAVLRPTMTLMLAVANLVIPAPGEYSFRVSVNGEERGSRPFTARLLPSAPALE